MLNVAQLYRDSPSALSVVALGNVSSHCEPAAVPLFLVPPMGFMRKDSDADLSSHQSETFP